MHVFNEYLLYMADSVCETTSRTEKCQRQKYDETTIDLKLNRTLTLCK